MMSLDDIYRLSYQILAGSLPSCMESTEKKQMARISMEHTRQIENPFFSLRDLTIRAAMAEAEAAALQQCHITPAFFLCKLH